MKILTRENKQKSAKFHQNNRCRILKFTGKKMGIPQKKRCTWQPDNQFPYPEALPKAQPSHLRWTAFQFFNVDFLLRILDCKQQKSYMPQLVFLLLLIKKSNPLIDIYMLPRYCQDKTITSWNKNVRVSPQSSKLHWIIFIMTDSSHQ